MSKIVRTALAIIVLLILVSLNAACTRSGESASPKNPIAERFPELAVKQELQRTVDANFHPKPLTLRPYRSAKNGAGANYVFPASITYSDEGALYVSDNNGHRIHYWAIDSPTITALPGVREAVRTEEYCRSN